MRDFFHIALKNHGPSGGAEFHHLMIAIKSMIRPEKSGVKSGTAGHWGSAGIIPIKICSLAP
jgi:hypothetical protein